MEFASEMVVNAARSHLRIGEVPVDYRVRAADRSCERSPTAGGTFAFLMLYSPTHLFVVPGLGLLVLGFILLVALLPGPVVLLAGSSTYT